MAQRGGECSSCQTGNGANRRTSWQVAPCYFTGASEWACHCKEPQLGHGRSHCCLLIRRGNTAGFVCFDGASLLSHIKVRPWSTVWAVQVGSNFASPISIWQRERSRAFKICENCQYFTNKRRYTMWWMEKWLYSELRVLKDNKPRKKKNFQGTLHMTVVFT